MLSDKMKRALNTQVSEELASAHVYLAMAAYFDAMNLLGFSHWMKVQAEEERAHAMRFYNYLYDRGAQVKLQSLEAPDATWDTPLEVFEDALAHEQKISGLINDLMDLAIEEKDHATQAFLHWFVNEQVEEEANADDVIQRLNLVGDSKTGLYILNQEMAQREAPPETEEQSV